MKRQLKSIVPLSSLLLVVMTAGCSSSSGTKAVSVPPTQLPVQSLASLAQKCQGNFNNLSPADQKTATEMAGNRAPQALQALYQSGRK